MTEDSKNSKMEAISLYYKEKTKGDKGNLFKVGLSAAGCAFVDKFLSYPADQIEKEKLQNFIDSLASRIENLENLSINPEFYSSFKRAARSVVETDQSNKTSGFANILSKAINENISDWDEAQQAIKIQEALEDRHIEALAQISQIEGWFVLGVENSSSPDLIKRMPKFSPLMVELIVMDLIGQGLVNDTDVDRSGTNSVSLFKLSAAGKWFIEHTMSNSL